MPETVSAVNVKEWCSLLKLPGHLPVFSLTGASSGQLRFFHDMILPLLAANGLLIATVRTAASNERRNKASKSTFTISGECGWKDCLWSGDVSGLGPIVQSLAREADLVLVENRPNAGQQSIVLQQLIEHGGESLELLTMENDPTGTAAVIYACLERLHQRCPIWACILIGGKSSRMGQPKHLLSASLGMTWLERTVRLVQPYVDGVALSGAGEVPASLASIPRLADIPDVAGPMTGILSAMRWQPAVTWLLLACDMPGLSSDAVKWVLTQRAVGCCGVVPQISSGRAVEPLFATYEPQCAGYFEQMNAEGVRRIGRIAEQKRVRVVQVPEELRSGWQNINTPEELSLLNDLNNCPKNDE